MGSASVKAIFQELAGTGAVSDLVALAQACRASNLTALECAPELYTSFPTSTASELGAALVETWACELSSSVMTQALTACKKPDNSAAFTAAEIAQSVSDNLSLLYLDSANIPTQYGAGINNQLKMIGLSQGDLVTIKPAEKAMFLVISCLPGDYSPTPGSMIAALDSAYGINIATMATDMAADYRSTHHCWISKDISGYTSTDVPYQQLLVFESNGSDAVANIPGIFAGIQEYMPTPPAIPDTGPTIISAMVSTGSAGADPSSVLEALFNSCWSLMTDGAGYNMTCFRAIVYQSSWSAALTTTFDQLKQQHNI